MAMMVGTGGIPTLFAMVGVAPISTTSRAEETPLDSDGFVVAMFDEHASGLVRLVRLRCSPTSTPTPRPSRSRRR
jgi:hypothetical protein